MLRNHNYSLVYEVDVDVEETPPTTEPTETEPPTTETTEPETEPPTTETTEPETEPTTPECTTPETVDIKVTKTWCDQNDKYGKRPSRITVYLMADGKKVSTGVLKEEYNWKGTFKNMPKYNAEGKEIVYTVSEKKVANYTTVINGYDIVNTYKKPILRLFNSDGTSPRTGDYIFIAVAVAIISGGLLIVLIITRKNKKR